MTTITKGKIISQDIAYWDGVSTTVNRKDSTGGTIAGIPVGGYVDVYMAYGQQYTRGVIQDCVNRIGSLNRTLYFRPGTWVIDDDLTVGSNFICRVPNGCVFQVASGKTLTFSGAVITDGATWTSGSGTVTQSGARTFSGPVTFSGTGTLSGALTVSGDNTYSGTSTFTGSITNEGIINYAASSGTNTYTATLSPAITAYTTGTLYYISIGNANTSSTPTLNLNSLGAKTVVRIDGSSLANGNLDGYHIFQYDGTNMRVLNPANPVHRGALLTMSANQSISNASYTSIAFNTESYDTDSIHDTSTNNERLTVPTGITKVRIKGQLEFAANSTGQRAASIDKNGTPVYFGRALNYRDASSSGVTTLQVSTAILSVTAGDYFTLEAYQSSGGALNAIGVAQGYSTWFSMEIIE